MIILSRARLYWSLGIFTALVFGAQGLASADDVLPDQVWAVTPADVAQDVVLLQQARPLIARFQVWSGEKGFRMAWEDYMASLHQFLDKNNDGKLSADEYSQQSLSTMVNSPFGGTLRINGQFPDMNEIDSAPKDGSISIAEFTAKLRPLLTPFVVQSGGAPDPREDLTFKQLDRDKDGKITPDDLTDVAGRFAALDLDDDEMIISSELNTSYNPFAARQAYFNNQGMGGENLPFVELDPSGPNTQAGERIIAFYDNGGPLKQAAVGDKALARCEIGLDEASFLAADSNRNAKLSAEEILKWLGHAQPDFEFRVELPDATHPPKISLLKGIAKPYNPANRPGMQVQPRGIELDFTATNISISPDMFNNLNNVKQFYVQQFDNVDGDKSGSIERKEVQNDFLGQYFDVMDRNKDEKVTKEELEAFADMQEGAASSRVVFRAADKGHAIYELLDTNHDSRLSVREIRSAAKLLSLDRDGDHKLTFDEIAHKFRVKVGRGNGGFAVFDPDEQGFGFNQAPPVTPLVEGASWFHRMDRNRDGDVSRREFLGTGEIFRMIDTDGDGLIDPKEAVAASDLESVNR